MTWRTHLVGGLASLALIPFEISSTSLALFCLFAALGSLLPDLDARVSKLSTMEVGGMTLLKPAAQALNRHLGHRGAFHSLATLLLVAIVIGLPLSLFLDPFAGVGLVLGFVSHLLLDACTRSGIPLWWPSNQRTHFLPYRLRITTGSQVEDAIFFLLAVATVFFLLQSSHLFSPTY